MTAVNESSAAAGPARAGLAVGVDIGGTKIAAGVVDDRGVIIAEDVRPTPAADAIISTVAVLVEELGRQHDVQAVGIGAAGFVDADRSTMLFSPNIDWVDEPLGQRVSAATSLPVVVENDANAAAWGEFVFGVGADVHNLVLITVGTGIGGGLVHDDNLYRGGFGVAAEIGHMRVVRDGLVCGCGQRGCFEQYASGVALVRNAGQRVGAGDATALTDHMSNGVVDGSVITELAQQGDLLCIELLADLGTWLGEGLASLAAILDPAVVAIGGGVASAGPLVLEPTRAAFELHLPAGAHRPHPELRLATLGNLAGIIGAADLARRG